MSAQTNIYYDYIWICLLLPDYSSIWGLTGPILLVSMYPEVVMDYESIILS